MRVSASTAYLVIGGALCAAAALAGSSVPESAPPIVLGVGSSVAVWIGMRRHHAIPPVAWRLVALVPALVALAAVARSLDLGGPFEQVVHAAEHVLPLLVSVVLVVALLVMLQRLIPDRDLAGMLDAGIVGFAMFSVLWMVELDELFSGDLAGVELLSAVAHPVLDVVLTAAAVRLAVSIRLQNPAFVLVVAGALSLAGLDALRIAATEAGARPISLLWLAPVVLLGGAALHPGAGLRPAPSGLPPGWLTQRRFTMIVVATVAVPLVDLFATGTDRVVIATSSAVLFILVMTRVFWLMNAVNRSHERLEHVAFHDPLTGLANRSLFADRVRHALLQRDREQVTVLLVDLDDFKTVNDSLGHQAGDALLVSVASRMTGCTREGDTVARLGGDEFAILLENALDHSDAMHLSQRIISTLAEPARFGEHELSISASIGIATATRADDVDSLLRNADVAMYLAKSKGKNRFELFEESMYDDASERLSLKSALHAALERGEFELHYQPIVRLADQQLASVEALIRWHHPERGFIPPDRFIPLAEETGLIVPIGRWVFREACRQARRWQQHHPEHTQLGVSVNVSVRQMSDPDLIDDIATALTDSGLDPAHLTVEITESQLMGDTDLSVQLIADLKRLGVRVAIDDFGTGYSSLSYLRSFTVDVLKIDRSFVNELSMPGMSEALVRSVIYLADALGAVVTAEGIEGFDQADVLARLGCHYGQGFLISKPLPLSELEWLLAMPLSQSLFAISTLRGESPRHVSPATLPEPGALAGLAPSAGS
jgi:diguanylate cyclase (GGDEF)-like protein